MDMSDRYARMMERGDMTLMKEVAYGSMEAFEELMDSIRGVQPRNQEGEAFWKRFSLPVVSGSLFRTDSSAKNNNRSRELLLGCMIWAFIQKQDTA